MLTMKKLVHIFTLFALIMVLATGCAKDPDDNGGELNQNQGEDVLDDSSEQNGDSADGDTDDEVDVECHTADDCTEEIPEHAYALCHANHCSWDCHHCESYKRCHLLADLHPTNTCRICSEAGWEDLADHSPCGEGQICQAGECVEAD